MQVVVRDGAVADARFTADACALCIAAASVLTDEVRGMPLTEVGRLDLEWLHVALAGVPPAGRAKCVALPLDTLRRAIAAAGTGTAE